MTTQNCGMQAALAPVAMRVTTEAIRAYAELTRDFNPIHLDAEFAKTTAMGGVIAHGTMSLNLIWQSLAKSLGSAALIGGRLQIRFQRPVRIGQEVTAKGTTSDGLTYAVWVENNEGVRVIEGTFLCAPSGA